MSKNQKLAQRFLSATKDFTYQELKTLLQHLGYQETPTGKTGGSRVGFYNEQLDDMIKLHRPHPTSIMKPGCLADIRKHLVSHGIIKKVEKKK